MIDDDGMLRMPSPDLPGSGYSLPHQRPGYGVGVAPAPGPAGTIFVPELGTHVDADVAAQFGLGAPTASLPVEMVGEPQPATTSQEEGALYPVQEWTEEELDALSDEELEALAEQLEVNAQAEPTPSETLGDLRDCFAPDDFTHGVDMMVIGDFEGTLDRIAEATGLDRRTAATLVETAVAEAAPIAQEQIGSEAWASLMYAATRTEDPGARRVVSSFVTGKLHPSKLSRAYDLWYDSLPDAD